MLFSKVFQQKTFLKLKKINLVSFYLDNFLNNNRK